MYFAVMSGQNVVNHFTHTSENIMFLYFNKMIKIQNVYQLIGHIFNK